MMESSVKPNITRDIVVGIVSSIIFFIFFQPFLIWLWGKITVSSLTILVSSYDNLFLIASIHKNFTSFYFLEIFLAIVLAFIIFKAISHVFPSILYSLGSLFIPGKTGIISLVLLSILLSILFGMALAPPVLVSSINLHFNQRIAILSPYISDQDYKMLQSSWATMKNYEDFMAIDAQLDQLAKENNIEFSK